MTRGRGIIAFLIALSLAVVPASVGASAAGMVAGTASLAASAASACDVPCPMADQADMMAGMPMSGTSMSGTSMSGDCSGMDGKSVPMTPSACAAFCSGFVALPASPIALIFKASDALPSPLVQARLTGRVDPPEPYPPRS